MAKGLPKVLVSFKIPSINKYNFVPSQDNAMCCHVFKAKVVYQEFEGHFWHLILSGPNDMKLKMSVINSGSSHDYDEGAELQVHVNSKLAVALPSGPLAAE